nr:universal stress protein PHOS34-like [Ipomoea batatas]
MHHHQQKSVHFEPGHHSRVRSVTPLAIAPPSLPRVFSPVVSPTQRRRVAIAVDLSDESAFAVRWAVQNYLRPGDGVVLLHVQPTAVLYGADWGISPPADEKDPPSPAENFADDLTSVKAGNLAEPLVKANVPFKIHIVKDHDLKERLCLEVERLGLSAMIMGSRGFGRGSNNKVERLGSVSDYCVHHCICPVVVVRYPGGDGGGRVGKRAATDVVDLHPVPEDSECEYHDADDEVDDEFEGDESFFSSPSAAPFLAYFYTPLATQSIGFATPSIGFSGYRPTKTIACVRKIRGCAFHHGACGGRSQRATEPGGLTISSSFGTGDEEVLSNIINPLSLSAPSLLSFVSSKLPQFCSSETHFSILLSLKSPSSCCVSSGTSSSSQISSISDSFSSPFDDIFDADSSSLFTKSEFASEHSECAITVSKSLESSKVLCQLS